MNRLPDLPRHSFLAGPLLQHFYILSVSAHSSELTTTYNLIYTTTYSHIAFIKCRVSDLCRALQQLESEGHLILSVESRPLLSARPDAQS